MVATMADVAKKANVSISTVSYVLSGERSISEPVKLRVQKAIEELKYKPNRIAQSLVKKSTRIIGLFGIDTDGIGTNIFFHQLMAGILEVTAEKNYNLIVYPSQKKEEGEVYSSLNSLEPIDGAIIIHPKIANEYLNNFITRNTPFLLVGRPSNMPEQFNFIDNDNVSIGYTATRYLISKGYEKIMFVNGPADYTISVDRLEGYKMALEEFGIYFKENLVLNTRLSIEEAFEAVKNAWNCGCKVNAIFASSDLQTIGAINALNSLGLKVPKDVAVICGSETFMTSNYNPRVTGIDVNAKIIGINAAKHIIHLIEKELIKPSHRIVTFKINEREST